MTARTALTGQDLPTGCLIRQSCCSYFRFAVLWRSRCTVGHASVRRAFAERYPRSVLHRHEVSPCRAADPGRWSGHPVALRYHRNRGCSAVDMFTIGLSGWAAIIAYNRRPWPAALCLDMTIARAQVHTQVRVPARTIMLTPRRRNDDIWVGMASATRLRRHRGTLPARRAACAEQPDGGRSRDDG